MADLKESRTRIVVMDLDGKVWGYRLRDYAADLADYVEENYTPVGPNLYVRKDAYPAALARLREAGYGTVCVGPGFGKESRLGAKLENGTQCEQRITAAGKHVTGVLVRLANYLNQNRVGAKLQLTDDATGEVIGESALPKEEIRDIVYSRFALKAETEPGKTYTLRIMADTAPLEGEDPALSIYCCPVEAGEEAGGFLNGEKQDFDWAAVIEYDPE